MTTPVTRSRLGIEWSLILVVIGGIAYAGLRMWIVPPVLHPSKMMPWWTSAGSVIGAMSILWMAVLVIGAYWLLLYTAAAIARSRDRTAWLLESRLPGTNRLFRSMAGASVLGVTLVVASGCGAPGSAARAGGRPPAAPVLVPVGDAPDATATTVPAGSLPEPGPRATPVQAVQPPARAPGTAATEWTVRPGDDLWSIAESVLADRLGRRPTDGEVARLWLRVVDANRAALPDPGNPNLIFAGEAVAVPW